MKDATSLLDQPKLSQLLFILVLAKKSQVRIRARTLVHLPHLLKVGEVNTDKFLGLDYFRPIASAQSEIGSSELEDASSHFK